MKKTKAAIFDLDGSLIDSMWIWENLLIDFLAVRGIETPEHLLKEVTHMSIIQSSAYVQNVFQLPMSADEILAEWRAMIYSAYAEKIKLKPGAKEYLVFLKNSGVKLAIATSCDHTLCEICLQNNNIRDLFDVIAYADEVGKGKNFPDLYLECLKRLKCNPEDTTLYEDILVALETGKSLGMQLVAVADQSASPDHPSMKNTADIFIHDFFELL